MKITKFACAIMLAISIVSCASDNDDEIISGNGTITVEFDNAYSDSDLLLNSSTYNAVGTEKLKISKVKYIVSNIRLKDESGTVFTYPKNDCYFIVDESDENSQNINLSGVPAANYTEITFGIGVDQARYTEGATGQGDFLTQATDAGMMWSWTAGYKFFVYEGLYTSATTTTETAFAFHMGSHGTALDNYKEVTLSLPNTARVRTNLTPVVHLVADLSKLFKGTNEFSLDEKTSMHVDAERSPKFATNVNNMFEVDHVHN